MKGKLNVLQICSYYTGTKLYHKLFTSLSDIDIEQNVYIFVNNSYELNSSVNYSIDVSYCYNGFDRLFFYLKHSKVLRDIENKYEIEKFDIFHAHSLFSNGYIAYKLNEKYNIPYVVAVRNTDVNLFFKRMIFLRKTGIKILKNANKVVFISEPYRIKTIKTYVPKDYQDEIIKKSIVIPNGIDEFWLKNKNDVRKNIPSKKKIRLIYVGSIDKNKNIDTIIQACKILLSEGYEIEYKLVGKIISKEYQNTIKSYDFISYIPYSPKEELINYYRESDIFVMPSKHETFGLVYAEAMSQGLPVIYTRGQGFDGQFEEGEVGYSVRFDDAEEVAEKVKIIINDYENIYKRCFDRVNKFDWKKISAEYLQIYGEIR